MSFSERMGYTTPRTVIQTDTLDGETRTAIWNALSSIQAVLRGGSGRVIDENIALRMWMHELKRPRDEMPAYTGSVWDEVKAVILQGSWYAAFDYVEVYLDYLVVETRLNNRQQSAPIALEKILNEVFERYLVGFRFINRRITPVDSEEAATAVNAALVDSSGLEGAHHHIRRSVNLLADRQNPDYPNSIKEAISAVEAVVLHVTGKTTLGNGLKHLKESGVTLHPALEKAWTSMYGWASDEDGIRHAGINAAQVDQKMAKYMLVTCAAFVSYLIEATRAESNP